jgi:hypothetical protein
MEWIFDFALASLARGSTTHGRFNHEYNTAEAAIINKQV